MSQVWQARLHWLLRIHYWYARPLVVVIFLGMLAGRPRSGALVLDVLVLVALWCWPLWARRRLLKIARLRDPDLARQVEGALQEVDRLRDASKLPWVRAAP